MFDAPNFYYPYNTQNYRIWLLRPVVAHILDRTSYVYLALSPTCPSCGEQGNRLNRLSSLYPLTKDEYSDFVHCLVSSPQLNVGLVSGAGNS